MFSLHIHRTTRLGLVILFAISMLSRVSFGQGEVQNTGAGPFWRVLGNSNTNVTNNFLGTIDAVDLTFRTTNARRMTIQAGGNVGIGTINPPNLFSIDHANTTAATATTYPFAIQRASVTELTAGMDASYTYIQAWNNKPLLLNSQANYIGINLTTAPLQNLDINGRLNVRNGVIQRGTTTINVTSDLGLYSQVAGNWIRIASNAAPIKFFIDQGGANSAGTNALVAMDNSNGGGVMIAAEFAGTGNAGAPYSRAALELSSTSKGFLMPRMTNTQRDAMGNTLAEGLMIYNTDNDCFEWWDTKATPNGGNGFWNSVCETCDNIVIVSASQTGFNLSTYVGGGKAENYCVYIQAGVTLTPAGNGGGSGVAGNSGFNASTMPTGAKVSLFNYGTIYGGGGNGGQGGQESDAVCRSDANAQAGGTGGHAILTNSGVPVTCFNYGTIRAGGGGGGGGGRVCCSAGGGGGGGAGTPAGSGGAGITTECVSGTICGCNTSTSGNGNPGTALTGGTGGIGANRPATGCPTCNGNGAGNGGTGGTPGNAGAAGTSSNNGAGGAAGRALQGNGSGSSLSNISGTVTGTVVP